jgi:8-oxo-dGTP pyrophosphatase MutT (NUDIX family)/phosphohistidine phosphatase SixA
MPDPGEPGEIRAAGAVLWRPGPTGPEVALVHRPRYDDWAFPKGKSLPGEHVLVTAVREVGEETGITVVLGRRLSQARYLSNGQPKRVEYWAARAAAGTGARAGAVPNDEVDRLEWLPVPAAGQRLSYPHDARLLSEFASAPPASTACILLRHAAAQSRKAWLDAGQQDDLPRPLTARGQGQARRLAPILACFGPARVVSSSAERCLATVRPYAALVGVPVEAEPAFLPGAPQVAMRDQITALAAGGQPLVICGHRENLPGLLAAVCERLGAPVPPSPPLTKGAFWALQLSQGRVTSAEQHSLAG